jgi:hypothetical protein
MMNVVMNKFNFGNAQIPGVYFDEENRRQLDILRRAIADLVIDLCNKNRKEDAIKVLTKTDAMLSQENFPYYIVSRGEDHNSVSFYLLQAAWQAGYRPLFDRILHALKTGLEQEVRYYNSLPEERLSSLRYDDQNAKKMLADIENIEQMSKE